MAEPPLTELVCSNIQNVYIYIGDAVRWDSVPDDLLNSGLAIKSVAAGIHSPTSIASIVSGTYLSQHGVRDFTDRLSSESPSLLDTNDLSTVFMNTINDVRFDPSSSENIIVDIFDTDHSEPEAIESVDPPFLALERGPGGHAPYARDSGLTSGKEYFETRGNADRSQFRREYNQAVREDVEWFFSRVETLRDRRLLDETLVIYVSDHGELLGESGALAHTSPIHPSHVYVPTVFLHPDLEERVIRDRVARHVDLVPTVRSLLDHPDRTGVELPGRDLSTERLASRGLTLHDDRKEVRSLELEFRFDSVWDAYGGYVVPKSSRAHQFLLACHRLARIPWRQYAKHNLFEYLGFYLRGHRLHGTPAFTVDDALSQIKEARGKTTPEAAERATDISEDRLAELGYIE